MGNHKDLDAWKLSIDFVSDIYKITQSFPSAEIYGLSSQMRRCAVSIPSNIAEGSARQSDKELIQFLHISLGSLAELETQILIKYHQKNYFGINKIFKKQKKIKIFSRLTSHFSQCRRK